MANGQKCWGEFICSNCGKITKKSFIIHSEKDLIGLHVDCTCGKRVEQYVPTTLRESLLCLASKGYKIRMINEKTVGIVFNGRIPVQQLPQLPHEFVLDSTEPEGEILMNQRCQYQDFEGLDMEQYYKEARENLLDFCRQLPTISNGEYEVIEEAEEV